MMQIEIYSDKYKSDIVGIVQNFHDEAVKEYDNLFDPEAVVSMISNLEDGHAQNAFLLIINGKCEGLLAGIEIVSMLNKKRTFQELIWYVNKPFRHYGVILLNKVLEILKERGFSTMIMAVLENSKTVKIKSLFDTMGFRAFESHYIRSIE